MLYPENLRIDICFRFFWVVSIIPMNIFKFVNEVRAEISKVTWPTRADTIRLTIIVLGISVGVGL